VRTNFDIYVFIFKDSESDDDPSNKYVTVIPVGFGEKEENDRIPGREPMPYW
jgi:hypothetical protein